MWRKQNYVIESFWNYSEISKHEIEGKSLIRQTKISYRLLFTVKSSFAFYIFGWMLWVFFICIYRTTKNFFILKFWIQTPTTIPYNKTRKNINCLILFSRVLAHSACQPSVTTSKKRFLKLLLWRHLARPVLKLQKTALSPRQQKKLVAFLKCCDATCFKWHSAYWTALKFECARFLLSVENSKFQKTVPIKKSYLFHAVHCSHSPISRDC